jgi:hypothetical protein
MYLYRIFMIDLSYSFLNLSVLNSRNQRDFNEIFAVGRVTFYSGIVSISVQGDI